MMTCSVCKRAGSDVAEYKSTLSNKKAPYCLDCLYSGREPYEELVAFGWEFNMFNKTYLKKVVLPTLAFNNKTIEQFNEEVRKKREEKDV